LTTKNLLFVPGMLRRASTALASRFRCSRTKVRSAPARLPPCSCPSSLSLSRNNRCDHTDHNNYLGVTNRRLMVVCITKSFTPCRGLVRKELLSPLVSQNYLFWFLLVLLKSRLTVAANFSFTPALDYIFTL